ncbi:SMI1/KNR4 family protein [Chryseobacterium arthrosphaerae]|uniref:SMI1/KNR4 family protein n=1 Tax=Chryseobacterium arthrosphaerae TaxID=651561 RepID=UPI0023E0BCE0|nr:SMI1/KNR4 family protein [Chryseobacterium arthrosphaerae]WES96647.1 SMI1/KNR4 family protein [Chryseobacterium arthrosphaerae]
MNSMEIVYLKAYERYKKEGKGKRRSFFGPPIGLSEAEIIQLEETMNNGIPFPKAYREYLSIGGAFSSLSLNDSGNNAGKLAAKYKQALQMRKVDISRPIAIMDTFEGQCGTFIYLDNGDNPQPWLFSIHEDYDSDEGKILWPSPFKTLQDMIEQLVYTSENDLSI